MRYLFFVACLICMLIIPTAVSADVVTDWNDVTLEVVFDVQLPPTESSHTFAMVHAAIYDSVNAVYQCYEPYVVHANPPKNTSPQAAAAAAAHRVLSYLYPDYTSYLDRELKKSLSSVSNQQARQNGVALGQYVADKVIRWRRYDGSNRYVYYKPGDDQGEWRPTPTLYGDPVSPNWGYVDPFAVTSAKTYVPGPPPALPSKEYAEALNEVALLGSVNSRLRTRDQTEIAYFWADDFDSITVPGRWNDIAQVVSKIKRNTLLDNARLFALINVAMADSAIVVWKCKYYYALWRPITAIREANNDYNKWTKGIPNWTSLLENPSHPEYVSGHSTFGAAAATVFIDFYGTDNIKFTLQSTSPQAGPRTFKSFSSAAIENGRSRIYGGIHFEFSNQTGLKMGKQIGNNVYYDIMRPMR